MSSVVQFTTTFQATSLFIGKEQATLQEIYSALATYCGPIGIELMHIAQIEEHRWFQRQMEGHHSTR